MEVYMGRNRRR